MLLDPFLMKNFSLWNAQYKFHRKWLVDDWWGTYTKQSAEMHIQLFFRWKKVKVCLCKYTFLKILFSIQQKKTNKLYYIVCTLFCVLLMNAIALKNILQYICYTLNIFCLFCITILTRYLSQVVGCAIQKRNLPKNSSIPANKCSRFLAL